MHLVHPPKCCITIVFGFSWDDCNTQEKLETIVNLYLRINREEKRQSFPVVLVLVCLDSFSSLCNFLFEEHFLFGYIIVLAGKKLLLNIFEDSLSFDVEYSSKYFKTARDVGKNQRRFLYGVTFLSVGLLYSKPR